MKREREYDIIVTKSVAEIVRNSDISGWKKWVLEKLMPPELFTAPPQKLAQLQKGAKIGSIVMNIEGWSGDVDPIFLTDDNGGAA